LRTAIESLSGIDLDGVQVHYGSAEPARFGAHAFTQGSEIHLGPGQERHLAHEAWHVVQQAQGRVAPTVQMKGGLSANHDPALEAEADAMGDRAQRHAAIQARLPGAARVADSGRRLGQPVLQRVAAGHGVRQFACGGRPSLDKMVNQGTRAAPSDVAELLTQESPDFAHLRGQADTEVKKTFGRDQPVRYSHKPATGSGDSLAYYLQGDTYFDKNAPMPATVLNVIFETANAAQAGKFHKVAQDYDSGVLAHAPISDYLDPSQLGKFVDDFHDAASKRSLIQECYEWNSFELARTSMLSVQSKFKTPEAFGAFYGFGELLQCKSFEEYYETKVGNMYFAKMHRASVEESIRRSDKQKQDRVLS
jgi:hypothetical protein